MCPSRSTFRLTRLGLLLSALLVAPRGSGAQDANAVDAEMVRVFLESGNIGKAWKKLAGLPLDHPLRPTLDREVVERAEAKARDAARRILEGKPEDAVPALLDAKIALPRRASIHLYLALAYFTRSLKGGGSAALDERARAAIREARSLSPDLEPDPAVFSPRFRAFFKEVDSVK